MKRLLQQSGGLIGAMGALLFLGLGFMGTGVWAWPRISALVRGALEMRAWVPVEAQVELLDLDTNCDGESCSYRVVCRYKYVYDGVCYPGQRVGLADGGPYEARLHYGLLKQKRDGDEPVYCYVNPRDPRRAVLFRELRWQTFVFWLPPALTFPLAGGAMLAGAGYILRRTLRICANERRHPGQPWLWRADWATGTVKPTMASGLLVFWFFCLFWNSMAWPGAFLLGADAASGAEPPIAWVFVAFPIVGLVLIGFALRMTVRHARGYWRGELRLRTVPIRLGRTLEGELSFPDRARLPRELRLELQCEGPVPSEAGVEDEIGWRSTQTVPVPDAGYGVGPVSLPVRLPVPADALPSTYPALTVRWCLLVTAAVPARWLKLDFPVPVFGN